MQVMVHLLQEVSILNLPYLVTQSILFPSILLRFAELQCLDFFQITFSQVVKQLLWKLFTLVKKRWFSDKNHLKHTNPSLLGPKGETPQWSGLRSSQRSGAHHGKLMPANRPSRFTWQNGPNLIRYWNPANSPNCSGSNSSTFVADPWTDHSAIGKMQNQPWSQIQLKHKVHSSEWYATTACWLGKPTLSQMVTMAQNPYRIAGFFEAWPWETFGSPTCFGWSSLGSTSRGMMRTSPSIHTKPSSPSNSAGWSTSSNSPSRLTASLWLPHASRLRWLRTDPFAFANMATTGQILNAVEIGSWSHYLQGFIHMSGGAGYVQDFWTINSTTGCRRSVLSPFHL